MADIVISPGVLEKLRDKHQVADKEVWQCFANRTGRLLTDSRETHQTDPPTQWFIAPTNQGRLLKICFVPDGSYFIRTAYPPNEEELRIYRKYAEPHDF